MSRRRFTMGDRVSQSSSNDREAEVAALAAIYQGDRADASATLNTSLALIGAGVAYLVGTIALWDKFSVFEGWVALLPFPLICVSAFQSLLVASAVVKAHSVLLIEERLKDGARLTLPSRDYIGSLASERVMNVAKADNWAYMASTIMTYGGIGAIIIILAYTVVILILSATYIGAWVIVPAIGYAAMLSVVGLSWAAATAAAGRVPA